MLLSKTGVRLYTGLLILVPVLLITIYIQWGLVASNVFHLCIRDIKVQNTFFATVKQ